MYLTHDAHRLRDTLKMLSLRVVSSWGNNATSGGCTCTMHAAAGPLDVEKSSGFMSGVYKDNHHLAELDVEPVIFPQQQADKQIQSCNPHVHGHSLLLKV